MKLDSNFILRLSKQDKQFLQSLPNASKILRLYIELLKQNEQIYNNELEETK